MINEVLHVYNMKYDYPDLGGAVVSGISPEHACAILKLWWENHSQHSWDIPSFSVNNFNIVPYVEDNDEDGKVIFQCRTYNR